MLLYILDSLLRRDEVVDNYESLIWTERWWSLGDFEMSITSTPQNRNRFVVGRLLALNKSYRVMEVEFVEDSVSKEGEKMLTVKGRSLERVLDDRITKFIPGPITDANMWVMNDTPGTIVRTIFGLICRDKVLSGNDGIPFLQPGTLLPLGNIPESSEIINHTQKPESLLVAIQNLCKVYDLGFRLVRNFDASELYFEVYSGNDLTTQQSQKTPVVFSPQLDNIQNYSEIRSIQDTKNTAYAYSDTHSVLVYGPYVDAFVSGFERRVMLLNPQVPEGHPSPVGFLEQEARKALQEQREHTMFDGEVDERSAYIYGVDYEVGDLVELRNQDGVIRRTRITEQIFVDDQEGERSYPTLAIDISDLQNTWLSSANSNETWADYTTEVWADG